MVVLVWKCLREAAPIAIWLTCVCRPIPFMVASNCVPRRRGLYWSRALGPPPVSAASPSMDHEHGTVCQPILEHQIRLSAPSSVISRPTCFSSSLHALLLPAGLSTVRQAPLWLSSEFGADYKYSNLLTYWPPNASPGYVSISWASCWVY